MSGHSKWHNIRIKKGKMDAQRGKIFTKVSREILMAARAGGGDPNANLSLKTAIAKARAVNMPMDNIKRVIDKATGGDSGENYEEILYEGYAPFGVAVLFAVTTDNRNRTAPEVRNIFGKYGGSMAEAGSVAWMFDKKGVITVPSSAITEDALFELAAEAGAEDVRAVDDETFEIVTAPADFHPVQNALDKAGIKFEADLSMIPKTTVVLNRDQATAVLKLLDVLEDHDDVSRVWANFDIPSEVMEEMAV